jgi:eukaryotic-like serine/threonine-protein kinase
VEGTTLSHFRLISKLGEGGMAVVYKAEDTKLCRPVALKVLPPAFLGDEKRRRRFLREARAAAAISHPNIAGVHEVDEDSGVVFIAMEYVEGKVLTEVIGGRALPVDKALGMARQIAHGLDAAHRAGVVHRDLKPGNLMLQADGRVRILDFGLAKLRDPITDPGGRDADTLSELTADGGLVGTISYMSPEQARGLAVDHRSDLFSLGVLLYEMLTGRNPFRGPTRADTLSAILKDRPVSASEVNPEVGTELARVVDKLLAKEMGERYASAREFLADLDSLGRGEATPFAERRSLRSIAVLPFIDMSVEKDLEYFCEGMAEELINSLTKIEGLRVAARTSTFGFKGRGVEVRRIGETLKVEAVLEGSVRKAGRVLRMTAQLINVADGYHLWSERYDREIEDVFAVQDEIASTIVDTLKIKLGMQRAPYVKRHTTDIAAYHLYLKGRYYWHSRYEGGLQKAITFFEQALERDPGYALAYVGLADSYNILGTYSFLPPRVAFPKAKAAAERALALDHTLAEAHVALGLAQCFFDWEWKDAERAFCRALALDRRYVQGHIWYGFLLSLLGRVDEARLMATAAQEVDPLSPFALAGAGAILCYCREHDAAIRQCEMALGIDPNFLLAVYVLGLAYFHASRFGESVTALRRAVELSRHAAFCVGLLGGACAASGRREEAAALLRELIERSEREYVGPMSMVRVSAGLGDRDQAFEWLERAYEERSSYLVILKVDAMFASLRSDPRYHDLLRRLRLAA